MMSSLWRLRNEMLRQWDELTRALETDYIERKEAEWSTPVDDDKGRSSFAIDAGRVHQLAESLPRLDRLLADVRKLARNLDDSILREAAAEAKESHADLLSSAVTARNCWQRHISDDVERRYLAAAEQIRELAEELPDAEQPENTGTGDEIPAAYRDGQKHGGEPLTAKYVARPETYGLGSSELTRDSEAKNNRIKQKVDGQTVYIYRFSDVSRMSTRKYHGK